MSFVNDHMDPLDLSQEGSILDDVFVSRQENLESTGSNFVLRLFSLRRRSFVRNHLDGWCPLFEFHDPIRHSRERNNDEERSVLLLRLDEESDEGDRLNSLSKSLL